MGNPTAMWSRTIALSGILYDNWIPRYCGLSWFAFGCTLPFSMTAILGTILFDIVCAPLDLCVGWLLKKPAATDA